MFCPVLYISYRVHVNSSVDLDSFTDCDVDRNNHLNFHVGDTLQCHNITIYNDDVCDHYRYTFALMRDINDSNIGTDQAIAFIEIDDTSEPECSKSC